jgi:hypothetical protein
MDLDKYFFSKKNIDKLTNKLSDILNLKKTPDSYKACAKFLQQQMQITYNTYHDQKPRGVSMSVFLDKLNEKSLKDCVKLYQIKTKKKYNTDNYEDFKMHRDNEINRGNKGLLKRPEFSNDLKRTKGDLNSFNMNTDNFADFRSGNLTNNGYITATGDIGQNMTSPDSQNMSGGKKVFADEIEKRMQERLMEYEPRGNGSLGMDIGFGGQKRPQEINFRLDGGDSRVDKIKEQMEREMGNLGGNVNIDPTLIMGMGNYDPMMGMSFGNQQIPDAMAFSNTLLPPLSQQNTPQNNYQQNIPQNIPQNNYQQNMSQNMRQNFESTPLTQQDMLSKVNNVIMDRNNIMNNVAQNNNSSSFNPLMSPNMPKNFNMNKNNMDMEQILKYQQMMSGNQNFINGREVGTTNSLIKVNTSNINKNEKNIMSINYKEIQKMSSKAIGDMINKIKLLNSEETINKTNASNIDNKGELLNKILEIKKMNMNKEKEINRLLQNEINNVKKDESINSLSVITKKNNNKNINIINSKNKNHENSDNNDDNEEYIIKTKNNYKINIESQEHSEPEYFNDYMVALDKPLNNINSITLNKIKLPKLNINITNNRYEFKYIINSELKCLELNEGEYKLDELIDCLQEALDNEGDNIKINIESNNKVTICNQNNQEFILDNQGNSMLNLLGFVNNNYNNNFTYTSENCHKFINKIYLYFENISKLEPFCELNLFGHNNSITKEYTKPLNNLNAIIIKFKINLNENNGEEELYDFENKPHKLELTFNY